MPDESYPTHSDRLLLRAVAGEPLPQDDPEAAELAADIALLRTQVQGLGDALAARPAPGHDRAPDPTRPDRIPAGTRPPRRRRPLRLALGGLAAACALAVGGGTLWLAVQGGGTGDADSASADKDAGRGRAAAPKDGPRSAESLVACSRLIVEGRVERVDPVPGTDQDRITLRVTHTYKPRSGGAPTVTFPVDRGLAPGAAVGDRPLVSIPEGAQEPDTWALGAERTRLRTRIVTALPRAADLPCNAGQDG